MLRKIEVSVLLVLACVAFASAAQRQALKIVPDPSAAGIRKAADTVRVEWVQLTGAGSQIPEAQPLSGDIYYASAPAAGDLSKYRKLSSVVDDNALAPFGAAYNKRVTRFIPGRQGGRMGSGVYYVIAAAVAESGDTLYSDYLNLMVASAEPPAIIYPRADFMKGESTKMVSELAPLFQWKPVAGVPYYHVLLSDEPFATPDGKPNSNVNIIWQAITPNTRIAYGAPDPSNTIKASPPPLSPGKTYSWIVLNNYGNYSAFTSWDVVSAMDQVAGRFAIKADGGALKAPRPTAPARGNAFNNAAEIEFKWANIDTGASSYLLNIFSDGRTADFGMGGMGDFAMKMLVWEATVPRGAGDTLRVVLNAGGTLASGSYTWRVYALDSRGAAFTDNNSTSTFRYSKSAEGNLSVKTFETLGGVQSPVGFVELKPEVLDGSTMTPFLFYTNSNGALDNRRISAGVYRITAAKEGYCAYTSTVAVTPSGTASVQIPMSRPEAVLYGRALASNDSSALNSATVTAASEWGDTVFATTDGNGGFVLACRAADWVVTVQKPGFRASSPRRAALRVGDNKNFGDAYLERNQFTLSGVVRNSSGGTVVAARVRLLRGGVLVDEVSSTPQNGAYAFYVGSGVYTLTVEKPGFAMFSRSVAVAGTASQDVTLRGGAALVNGSIIGRSWVPAINAYANAPIASARVTFVETGAANPDTLIVISDPVFGKFSISLPHGKTYDVKVAAAGFGPEAAIRGLTTEGVDDGAPITYADTVYALAMIKGLVALGGGVFMGGVDVLVYDAGGRVAASAKSAADGRYEIRNIPNGVVTVNAGADGYFADAAAIDNNTTIPAPITITINNGRLSPNSDSYNIRLQPGDKAIKFDVAGYSGSGAVKAASPLNRTLFFNNAAGDTAELRNAGAGYYVVEAAPDSSNYSLLELSYHRFNVSQGSAEHTETLYFPFTYPSLDTVASDSAGVCRIAGPTGNPHSPVVKMAFYYRSEGSARFDNITKDIIGGTLPAFDFTPARDGCDLYYYFRVYLENGDEYGSSSQFFRAFVKPSVKLISRVAVEPGAFGGDTLFLPSSYPAVFAYKAFYSDRFTPLSGNFGTVRWSIVDSETGASLIPAGVTGAAYSYTTPAGERNIALQTVLSPDASNGYAMKRGVSDTVRFPIRVTGSPLKSIDIVRKGDAGPASSAEQIGFRIEALDGQGRPVTVSPQWSVSPRGAGAMAGDGVFTPSPGFFGTAGITVAAGGLTREYAEPGASLPGQVIYYALKHNASSRGDTANTFKGMRVAFEPGALRTGMGAIFQVAVPEIKNHVYRGSEDFRMVDSVSFDLTCDNIGAVAGGVTLMFDIPERLRGAAKNGDHEFRVARWFPDSLRWIPLDTAITRFADGHAAITATLVNPVEEASLSKKASTQEFSRAESLTGAARYALVTKTGKTSLRVSVSPHPFSPYIIPRKEYGANAKPGTCIKVSVEAPQSFVRSIKVHIYNATGKRVWAVDKPNAETGENRFWWDGRTSGRGSGRTAVSEEVWSEDFNEKNSNRAMCRNGRYFIVAIITDTAGKQRRAMTPVVLMK